MVEVRRKIKQKVAGVVLNDNNEPLPHDSLEASVQAACAFSKTSFSLWPHRGHVLLKVGLQLWWSSETAEGSLLFLSFVGQEALWIRKLDLWSARGIN